MPFDVATLRADFPLIVADEQVYLDNAATTQKPQAVIDALTCLLYTSDAADE